MAKVLKAWGRTDPTSVKDVVGCFLERAQHIHKSGDGIRAYAVEFFIGAAVGAATTGNHLLADQIASIATQCGKTAGDLTCMAMLERYATNPELVTS